MKPSFLVVDDEPDFLDSVVRMLRVAGYGQITPVSDPTLVSGLLDDHSFDLAFLDVTMPGLNGIEVLKIIKEHSPSTACVMVTADESVPMVVEAMREGAFDYVLKPLHPDQLLHALERALARDRLPAEPVPTAAEDQHKTGIVLGQYQLVELLAEGGMGEVWLARHELLSRQAAVKLIRPTMLGAKDRRHSAVVRFEREAQTTASLRSPHTVELYDFGISDSGSLYYAMELLGGMDLHTLVQRFGPLPAERVVMLLSQACRSLAEAHDKGLVHRDIKPANLFVSPFGLDYDFLKVLDFGMVKAPVETDQTKLTVEGVAAGTPAFMAPELAVGDTDVDGRADLYALGCTAYWLLTGRMVFESASAVRVMLHHLQTPPSAPSLLSEEDVPEALDRLVLLCLAKNPADRPSSAYEMSRMLGDIPVVRPWDQRRAEKWWRLHAPDALAR